MSLPRSALLCLLCPLCLLCLSLVAYGIQTSKSINIRINVPALVIPQATTAPDSLPVTAFDVARGYVEVPVTYTVWTNNARGFALNAQVIGSCCDTIEVVEHASGRAANLMMTFQAGRAPGAFPAPVTFRIWLKSGVAPGVYAWPVQAHPLIAEP